MDIEAGSVFKKIYPYKHWCDEWSDGWAGGCHESYEDGADIFDNYCEQVRFLFADAEGFIEYEVLAFVEMPRRFQSRVLYTVTMIDPEGKTKKVNKCYCVTEQRFRGWIERDGSSYPCEYEVKDDSFLKALKEK